MNTLTVPGIALPPTTGSALEKIIALEKQILECEQTPIQTEHVLHSGMYARTIRIPPGVVVTGALVRIPTILIAHGSFHLLAGETWHRLEGFQVVAASPGRKQVVVTVTETEFTMIFPTNAKTVEEAENEFTEESDGLMSRKRTAEDIFVVTGE